MKLTWKGMKRDGDTWTHRGFMALHGYVPTKNRCLVFFIWIHMTQHCFIWNNHDSSRFILVSYESRPLRTLALTLTGLLYPRGDMEKRYSAPGRRACSTCPFIGDFNLSRLTTRRSPSLIPGRRETNCFCMSYSGSKSGIFSLKFKFWGSFSDSQMLSPAIKRAFRVVRSAWKSANIYYSMRFVCLCEEIV